MHVLLAVDGSSESIAGTHYLAKLPFAENVRVTILTVTPQWKGEVASPSLSESILREEQQAKSWAAAARATLQPSGFEVDCRIVAGNPNSVILEQAAELNVDLIVLGARGHWVINRLILGSTAEYVANNAHCSVLICRPGETTSEQTRSIMVAFDGSATATQAYCDAMKFNWPESTHLHVLYALVKPQLIDEAEDYDPQAIAAAHDSLRELTSKRSSKCQILNTVTERPHVGNAIQSKVEQAGVELLFMGATNKSAAARFFLGSVGRYLLHNCTCSLWLARTNSKPQS